MGKKTQLPTSARLSAQPRPGLSCAVLSAAWLMAGAPASLLAQPAKPAASSMAAAQAQMPSPTPSPVPGSAPAGPASRTAQRPAVGCLIGPEVVADIGSPVTAVVTQVAVDRGDEVRTGQTLVLLESEVERNNLEAARLRAAMDADILAAEANSALARQRHARAVELVGQGFTSPQTLEQAKAEKEVAEQKLRQARSQKAVNTQELSLVKAQLDQRTLKSPFNGVVIERFVSPGERAEDKPLLRLAMLNPLRVELVMPATRWGQVAPGDKLPILPELPNASAVTALVTHVDKIIDAASNTFRVRLALPNPGNRLPAGARCRMDAVDTGVAVSPGPAGPGAAAPKPAAAALTPASPPAVQRMPASVKPVPSTPATAAAPRV